MSNPRQIVIQIAGTADSGKTTLMQELTAFFMERGMMVQSSSDDVDLTLTEEEQATRLRKVLSRTQITLVEKTMYLNLGSNQHRILDGSSPDGRCKTVLAPR